MRSFLALVVVISSGLGGVATAAPQDDFAQSVTGPWGRVDFSWQPYTGVLAKNSCPPLGVRQPSTVGLFGEGGTMWIEPDDKGKLLLHDGGPAPRVFTFARMETATSAIYREGTTERRLAIVGVDRLTEERVPAPAGVPATKYLRCKIKK